MANVERWCDIETTSAKHLPKTNSVGPYSVR